MRVLEHRDDIGHVVPEHTRGQLVQGQQCVVPHIIRIVIKSLGHGVGVNGERDQIHLGECL